MHVTEPLLVMASAYSVFLLLTLPSPMLRMSVSTGQQCDSAGVDDTHRVVMVTHSTCLQFHAPPASPAPPPCCLLFKNKCK